MRVLVAGAGAIGQWLGARFAAAGHDVTLLVRKRFRDAIDAGGLHVRGHTTFDGPIPCITEPAGTGPFDLVLITSKAYDTLALARATAPLLAEDGVLASMQNGLGNGEKLAEAVPPERVALALTSHGVTVEAPGRIYHAGLGSTQVGPLPGCTDDSAARRLEGLLADAGLDPQWRADMRGAVWLKAVVNAAINPVGALYGVRNGGILDDPDLHALSQALAREAIRLAGVARVVLPHPDPAALVDEVLGRTRDNKVSMLQDVEARRPTEIEQITGRLVRLGETLVTDMGRNDHVYGRIKDLERSYLGAERAEQMAWDELPYAMKPF